MEDMTKIAIVEDDQAISQMYRIKFEAEGYNVETAENGKLGLEMIETIKPDIVLLDLMMPEMNGDEMLKRLRATDWLPDPESAQETWLVLHEWLGRVMGA